MNAIRDLRVRTKVLAVVGVVLVLTCALVGVGVRGLSSVNDASTEISTNWLPSVKVTNALNTNTSD